MCSARKDEVVHTDNFFISTVTLPVSPRTFVKLLTSLTDNNSPWSTVALIPSLWTHLQSCCTFWHTERSEVEQLCNFDGDNVKKYVTYISFIQGWQYFVYRTNRNCVQTWDVARMCRLRSILSHIFHVVTRALNTIWYYKGGVMDRFITMTCTC